MLEHLVNAVDGQAVALGLKEIRRMLASYTVCSISAASWMAVSP
jgi:hypothetical protein